MVGTSTQTVWQKSLTSTSHGRDTNQALACRKNPFLNLKKPHFYELNNRKSCFLRNSRKNFSGRLSLAVDHGWKSLEVELERNLDESLDIHAVDLKLSSTWRLLLFSDGSVTRHLQVLTGQKISVECLEMKPLHPSTFDLANFPSEVGLIKGPLIQRQVLLKTSDGSVLAYAASWWSSDDIEKHLEKVNQPIWSNFSDQKLELFRQVCKVYRGNSSDLEKYFGQQGPFWGRHYVFFQEKKPLTIIYEVFSPNVDNFL